MNLKNQATLRTNIVKYETLKAIQQETLTVLSDTLRHSFGPRGSDSLLNKENATNKYTKDGHSILERVIFSGPIENAIKEDVVDITRHIVKTVGDGTTSAVLMAKAVFDGLLSIANNGELKPSEISKAFKETVEIVTTKIRESGREATLDDIYKIALVSTNQNVNIATQIKQIYEEFGYGVYIDVSPSVSPTTHVRYYDGMTLARGIEEDCFYNTSDNKCIIDDPEIYVFEDPIDTPEMIALFDAIIKKNMTQECIPTVILATKLSRDMSACIDKLTKVMTNTPIGQRPPFAIVTNIYDNDQLSDIARMCGAKPITKYIDPLIQKTEIENGNAPTPQTIGNFSGCCQQFDGDAKRSKFVEPDLMKDSNGDFTEEFKSLLHFLETSKSALEETGGSMTEIGRLKRRINSLKCNLVEFVVGGVSASERDNVRDLVEDAVLNCRSAAVHGVGFGANYSGLVAADACAFDKSLTQTNRQMAKVILNAYQEVSAILYDLGDASNFGSESLQKGCPKNIMTGEYDFNVLSSIETDCVILEAISKIITIMVNCNQVILQNPLLNMYSDLEN